MGKRELLLIAAFIVAGAIVYQATAPPPAPGERSFSIGGIIGHIRRVVRGNQASADVTNVTTHPVNASISELRVSLRIGDITIIGEDRADLGAELHVHSNGYDDAEAQRLARETVLKILPAGGRLMASVWFPDPGRQQARLVLKVPSRLQVKLDPTNGELEVSGVASVDLATSRGDTRIRKIAGRVSGTHRGGEILVADSGAVKLATIGSDVRLEQIHGEVSLNMRSGDLKGSELAGPIDLDTNGSDITIEKLEQTGGIVRLNASGGSVSLKGLRTEGRIDTRNANVDVVIDRAAPLAIYAEGGASVGITPPAGGYQLDAVASNGSLTLPAGTLQVTSTGQERRATGPVRGGGATITIRVARGNITVRSR